MAVARQDISDFQNSPKAVSTLCNEHRYMSLLLDSLEERLQGAGRIAATDYFLIHDIVRYMHEYPDAVHHPTENLMFARLVARDPSSKSAVQELQRDHEKLTDNTARIRKLLAIAQDKQSVAAADAVRAACKLYIDRLRAHMVKEESEVFPRAVASLGHRDWTAIEIRLNAVEDPLFGRRVDNRFRVLYEYFSGQVDNASQRITNFSFLQLDSFIESADALEKGVGEMVTLLSQRGNSLVDEGKESWRRILECRSLTSVAGSQLSFATFVCKSLIGASSDAASICIRTTGQMLAPHWKRK